MERKRANVSVRSSDCEIHKTFLMRQQGQKRFHENLTDRGKQESRHAYEDVYQYLPGSGLLASQRVRCMRQDRQKLLRAVAGEAAAWKVRLATSHATDSILEKLEHSNLCYQFCSAQRSSSIIISPSILDSSPVQCKSGNHSSSR